MRHERIQLILSPEGCFQKAGKLSGKSLRRDLSINTWHFPYAQCLQACGAFLTPDRPAVQKKALAAMALRQGLPSYR